MSCSDVYLTADMKLNFFQIYRLNSLNKVLKNSDLKRRRKRVFLSHNYFRLRDIFNSRQAFKKNRLFRSRNQE